MTEVRDLSVGDILERGDGSSQKVVKLSPFTEVYSGEVKDVIGVTVEIIAGGRQETFTLFPYDKFWKFTALSPELQAQADQYAIDQEAI